MEFSIKGKVRLGNEWRPFTKKIEAKSEKYARELIFSKFGANSGIKRSEVRIEEIAKA